MSEQTRSLLEQSRSGDRSAVHRLLQRYLPGLRAFVRLRMGRDLRARESCSDLVQSVCLELLRAGDGFEYRGEPSFKAWLYTTALNKVRERARYHRAEQRDPAREQPLAPTDASSLVAQYAYVCTPSQFAAERETLEQVERAFDQMPEDYREVITLARIVGLPHAEIARQMGRSEGAVRVLLTRALVRLVTLVDRMQQE